MPETLFHAYIEINCCFSLSTVASQIDQYQIKSLAIRIEVKTDFDKKTTLHNLFIGD